MVEREMSLPGFDPILFFAKLSAKEKRPAYFTSGSWTILSWNPSKTLRGKQSKIIKKLKKRKNTDSALPFCGGAIGTIDYEGRALLHRYDHALLWNGKRTIVVGDDRFAASVADIHRRPVADMVLPRIEFHAGITEKKYRKSFDRVKKGILDGDFYQLNLTYPFFAKSRADHRRLFLELLRKNPVPCASYIEDGKHAVLSLSPERFVTIAGGNITTYPIKGTRPRGKNASEDKKFANDLLKSEKEAAELNMIVDLLRNDVGKVSLPGTVKVLKHRELQKTPSVWHAYSVVSGKIDPVIAPIDAFASMFPGGSVTGCPKAAAMKEIRRLERRERGPYCGSMVLLSDNGCLDSTILIRTVVARKKKLSLGVGGGIVADSEWEQEFDETLKKARPFLALAESDRRVFRNGQELSLDNPLIKSIDPRNPRARGLFATMLVRNGKARDFGVHLSRLQNSAEHLGMTMPAPYRVRQWLSKALKNPGNPEERAKLVVTPKGFFIDVRPHHHDPSTREGVAVTTRRLTRRRPETKVLPYHREAKAFSSAITRNFHEALVINRDGHVTEAAHSNIFWVAKGALHTPKSGMLLGTTREIVLHLAKTSRLPVTFVQPTLADLLVADEIFLTRSLAGIVPVIRIDDAIIGNGKPGKVTKKLMSLL